MDEVDIAFLMLVMGTVFHRRRVRQAITRPTNRRWWVHPINQARHQEGAWAVLMERFREEFPDKHMQCMRMSKENFDIILGLIRPLIERADTHLRAAIPADQRLCVTLYYLATGDSVQSCALLFRLGESTIRNIIYDTCQAIWQKLSPIHMKTPATAAEWKLVAEGFNTHWNFPNCIGAVDGKHCAVQCPPNSGSEFFNYQKFFSIVLMAVCDSLYRFIYIDVGTPGRWSDGGTFDHCTLKTAMAGKTLNVPHDSTLPGSQRTSPYVIVGDEAFPLQTWLMRPFPKGQLVDGETMTHTEKSVFNYRLSRARRTIENAFGIMSARWRCLRKTLHMSPDNAKSVVLACSVLHNFLRDKKCETYMPAGFADSRDLNGNIVNGRFREEANNMPAIPATRARNPATVATSVRENLVRYLNDESPLEWQLRHVNRV